MPGPALGPGRLQETQSLRAGRGLSVLGVPVPRAGLAQRRWPQSAVNEQDERQEVTTLFISSLHLLALLKRPAPITQNAASLGLLLN